MSENARTADKNVINKYIRIPRLLPPAGRFPTAVEFLAARKVLLKAANHRHPPSAISDCAAPPQHQSVNQAFSHAFSECFGAKYTDIAASGKHAIYKTLIHLRQLTTTRGCLMAAYTCPDIVTAVRSAGFTPHFADVKRDSLDIDWATIPTDRFPEISVAILSNLYGLADSVGPDDSLPENRSSQLSDLISRLYFIDDASQAIFTSTDRGRVGLRDGTVAGVVSFGRGKALAALGGGAVISRNFPSTNSSDKTIDDSIDEGWEQPTKIEQVLFLKGLLMCSVLGFLESPGPYFFVSQLPFLRLGRTSYHQILERGHISQDILVAGLAAALSAHPRVETRKRWLEFWDRSLPASIQFPHKHRPIIDFVPTRLPLLLPGSECRNRVLKLLIDNGIGASASYPTALPEFKELASFANGCEYPGARCVASRILTLPVHEGVTERDVERACKIIQGAL